MSTDTTGGGRGRWVIGLLIIGALAVFGYTSFNQSLATYTHDYADVTRRVGELLQVPGVIDKSVPQTYDTAAGTFQFTMLDVETRAQRLPVVYGGVKPANFDEASQVVCVGQWAPEEGVFVARQLLVKCPSKEVDKLQSSQGSPS